VIESPAPAPGAPSPGDSVLGAIEDSISQCTFLQMTYTSRGLGRRIHGSVEDTKLSTNKQQSLSLSAENPHADGSAAPGARPPRHSDPHVTSPAPTTTGWLEDKCPVFSKLPLHRLDAAKMSPHIALGQSLSGQDRAQSPTAADSHCLAREDSAPHCNQPGSRKMS
jgi:hypothetical protein